MVTDEALPKMAAFSRADVDVDEGAGTAFLFYG